MRSLISQPKNAIATFCLVALSLVTSGCFKTLFPPRDEAKAVVRELGKTLEKREQSLDRTLESLLTDYLAAEAGRLEGEWNYEIALLKAHVYTETESKYEALREYAGSELRVALEPTLDGLKNQLDEERRKIENGAGSLEREHKIAVQLSSTLAYAHLSAEKIDKKLRVRFKEVRTQLISDIDGLQSSRPTFDSSAEAAQLMSKFRVANRPFRDGLDEALDALEDYIENSNPVELFARGFFGDTFSSILVDLKGVVSEKKEEIKKTIVKETEGMKEEIDEKTDITADEILSEPPSPLNL